MVVSADQSPTSLQNTCVDLLQGLTVHLVPVVFPCSLRSVTLVFLIISLIIRVSGAGVGF